ncbi:hypothetical protein [Staphylococcus epidermidis]|nr:hypothetical protein [Staphylococcus epidermidis]
MKGELKEIVDVREGGLIVFGGILLEGGGIGAVVGIVGKYGREVVKV